MKTERYFIYARKSTDDPVRQLRSIEDQLAEVREYAQREQLEIVDVLVERKTAKKPGRPIFNKMLKRIEDGEANGVLAWHPDRLSRNPVDSGQIVYLMDIGKIVSLKFPTCHYELNANGKLNLSTAFVFSKHYVDQLSENVKRGKRRKIHDGLWPEGSPMGFVFDRTTRNIAPDPKKAPLIQKMFKLYASGNYTLRELREIVTELGLRGRFGGQLAVSSMQNTLQNPIYYGVMRYKDELYEGKHKPLISKALFDKCQEVMKNKSRPKKPRYKPFLYRGGIRCGECGGFITMEEQKGHHYLRCTKKKGFCSQPYLREERVAEQIADQIRRVVLSDGWAAWFFEEIDRTRITEAKASRQHKEQLQQELALCETRLSRLMDAFLDELVSPEEYSRVRNKMIPRKRQLQESIEVVESDAVFWLEPFRRFLTTSNQAVYVAESGDCVEQWRFFKKVGSNLTLRGGSLFWEGRGFWQTIRDKEFTARRKITELKKQGGQAAQNYERTVKSERQDLNLRPLRPERSALAKLSYSP